LPPENHHWFRAIQNQVWALHPAKLEEMYLFFDRLLAGEKIDFPEAAAGKNGNKAEETYEIRDGVAILPVFGIIDKRMNMFMRFSGGTSTQLLARDFQKALADPQVQAILLDVDSPGGSVDGTKELADLILASREQKPVVAYADGLMASAAFWIGSGAQVILAPETAEVGSIGVALMHYDYSEADAKEGVKRTVITGGKYKRIASDEKPLSKEGQAYLQGMVDDYYSLFLEAVGRQRGKDPAAVHEEMADGRIFIGKKALKAGLIDQIGNFNDALALARAKGGAMPKNMTKATLQAENPELIQALLAEGAAGVTLEAMLEKHPEAAAKLRDEGKAAGVTAERERVVEIFEAAGGQGLMLQVLKNGTEVKDALKLMVANHAQMKTETLAAMYGAAPPVLGTEVPKVETHEEEPSQNAPIETRAKATWDKDSKLQAEFGGKFENYLIYARHKEAGEIKEK
jgi:capsid assembly protease